jgi:hypothetical protein
MGRTDKGTPTRIIALRGSPILTVQESSANEVGRWKAKEISRNGARTLELGLWHSWKTSLTASKHGVVSGPDRDAVAVKAVKD